MNPEELKAQIKLVQDIFDELDRSDASAAEINGMIDQAQAILDQCPNDNAEVVYLKGSIAERNSDIEQVIDLYQVALEKGCGTAAWRLGRIYVANAVEKDGVLLELLQKGYDLGCPRSSYYYVEYFLKYHNPSEALTIIEALLESDPENELLLKARDYSLNRLDVGARRALPSQLSVEEKLARVKRLVEGNIGCHDLQAQIILATCPADHPEVAYWQGRLAEGSNDDKAISLYQYALESGFGEAGWRLGRIYGKKQQFLNAQLNYSKGHELGCVQATYYHIRDFLIQGDIAQALKIVSSLLEGHPGDSKIIRLEQAVRLKMSGARSPSEAEASEALSILSSPAEAGPASPSPDDVFSVSLAQAPRSARKHPREEGGITPPRVADDSMPASPASTPRDRSKRRRTLTL